MKTVEIPPDKSNYGVFTKLTDDVQEILHRLIQDTAARKDWLSGSDEQKLADFFSSYMDELRVESLGAKPVQDLLEKIDALQTAEQMGSLMAELNLLGVNTPFFWYVNNDAKQSTRYVTYITQHGLAMPDRDYYLKTDAKFAGIREAYQKYISDLLALAGAKDANQSSAEVLQLETEMAQAQWSRVDLRDADKAYNKKSSAEMAGMLGKFDWVAYVNKSSLAGESEFIVEQPSYLSELAKLMEKESLETWKRYLQFQVLDSFAPLLSKNFVDLHFNFHEKKLKGVEAQEQRWKRAVDATDAALGEILGKLYVRDHFPPAAKAEMNILVGNLIKAYTQDIKDLDWMQPQTKKAALAKLEKFTPKIGYPDKWKDYSALEIASGDLVGNTRRANLWANRDMSSRLGKPIDRSLWFMTPQTVNAYYNPVMNEIVFPAAILQPPFFDLSADDAVNYGSIGAVIGHEISHGFDDQGAKYDGDGNLNNWWTEKDQAEFQKRGQALVQQYNQYAPFADVHVNGELTLGENIADFGGLTISYKAYLLSLDGNSASEVEGSSGAQRFFYGWAQSWRRKYRDDELRKRLITDFHSPSQYRANGVLSNMPEFYRTFGVKPGDGMYRDDKDQVRIW